MVTPKITASITVALIAAVSGPACAEEDCPVTIGSDTAFRAPWPNATSWFGSESLAVVLPKDGIWPTTKPSALISVKVFWYSTEFQAVANEGFKDSENIGFEARIRRLNPGVDDAEISGPNWAGLGGLGENWTMLTGIDFPSAGCWEIQGEYLEQSLTFVVKTVDHIEWTNRL